MPRGLKNNPALSLFWSSISACFLLLMDYSYLLVLTWALEDHPGLPISLLRELQTCPGSHSWVAPNFTGASALVLAPLILQVVFLPTNKLTTQ